MNRKQLFAGVKEEQKERARKIRELRASRKQDKRNGRQLWQIESDIWHLKWEFRHIHIAYCEMRGRLRHEIERPAENNKASQARIDPIKEVWKKKIDEDVCISAQGSN
jgi:hypothetical protein